MIYFQDTYYKLMQACLYFQQILLIPLRFQLVHNYKLIDTNHNYCIWNDYTQGEYWALHDHSLGMKNTVPNKFFHVYLARKFNNDFLELDIEEKLEKFHD